MRSSILSLANTYLPPLVLTTLMCISHTSQAINKSSIKIGVEVTDYSPYFYLDAQSNYQGAAREIIDLFAQHQEVLLNYDAMPVPRLFREFVKGQIDLKFPDNPLWSASLNSDVKVFYSQPVFKIKESLLVLKQAGEEVAKSNITKVGTILGFSVPGIAQAVANNELETVKTQEVEQLIHMLMSNRVDAVYFNESVALSISKKMYPNKVLSTHSQYPAFQYAYHLSSIKHPELIEAFNSFLISHAKQVDEIISRHGLKR